MKQKMSMKSTNNLCTIKSLKLSKKVNNPLQILNQKKNKSNLSQDHAGEQDKGKLQPKKAKKN